MTEREKYFMCILCKRRKKRRGSLFCKKCSKEGVFIKIKALRESKDYKRGWIATGMPQRGGRLPQREW